MYPFSSIVHNVPLSRVKYNTIEECWSFKISKDRSFLTTGPAHRDSDCDRMNTLNVVSQLISSWARYLNVKHWPFLYLYNSCLGVYAALARLCGCTDLSKPSLVAYAISSKISCAVSFVKLDQIIFEPVIMKIVEITYA